MTIGAPVLFKRIQVGKVEDIQLTEAGDVLIDLFIGAPNDVRLTEATRFWNASGFSIQLGGGGASLNVDSLISLLQGGISFDTVGSDLTPVEDGHVFELYPSETAARQNLFEDDPGERLILDTDFDGSVRGLAARRGRSSTTASRSARCSRCRRRSSTRTASRPGSRLRATLALVPQRLGITGTETSDAPGQALDLLAAQVDQGLRARLAASGLLTQTLFVDLAMVPDAPPAELDRAAEPNPLLPSAPSDVTSVATAAESVLQRVAKLPLEDVVDGAVSLLANVNALVTSEGVRAGAREPRPAARRRPQARRPAAASRRRPPSSPPSSPRPGRWSTRRPRSSSSPTSTTCSPPPRPRSPASAPPPTACPRSSPRSRPCRPRRTRCPSTSSSPRRTSVVDGMDAFVRSEGVKNLPASVEASLADLRGVVADLRTGGAIDNVNATLASARAIADQAAQAQLVAKLDGRPRHDEDLASPASAPPPTACPRSSTRSRRSPPRRTRCRSTSSSPRRPALVDGIDAFVKSEDVASLPASVQASLADLRGVVSDLRTGGAIDNVNASLASVRQITREMAAGRSSPTASRR